LTTEFLAINFFYFAPDLPAQELARHLNTFRNFAICFSFLSPITGLTGCAACGIGKGLAETCAGSCGALAARSAWVVVVCHQCHF
jgi:hypothetical protein